MAHLPQTINQLAIQGASFRLESSYLPQTLIELATIMRGKGSTLTINGNHYLPDTLSQLAVILGNKLTIIS